MATSSCRSVWCNTVVRGEAETCPKCGRGTLHSSVVRPVGAVMMLCGLVIVGVAHAISETIAPTFLNPGVATENGTFTGSADQGREFMFLFWLLMVFGGLVLLDGLFQLITARRTRIGLAAALATGMAAIAVGVLAVLAI